MRNFQLDSAMKTVRGTFYPTGWTVLMFPSEREARDAGQLLAQEGFAADALMLITPQDVREQLLGAKGDGGLLPSAGTEGDTVRRIADLAAKGHYGLMVHAPHQEESDRVVALLKDHPISYGQKYRKLIIEDIVA
jgi:hypothetical protein